MITRLVAFARLMWDKLVRYALKFGVVGLVGYVDRRRDLQPAAGRCSRDVPTFDEPIVPKIISVTSRRSSPGSAIGTGRSASTVARTTCSSCSSSARSPLGGLLIGLLCLYVSHYVLGFDNIVADNISGNVVGLFLGTAFRFLLYRFWVYGHHRKDGLSAREHKAEAAALAIFEDDAEASRDADGPARPVTSHD